MTITPLVTCVGVITADVIALVANFPERDGRMEADDILITGGGPASNAAVVLARQGIPTAIVGRVGDDEAGRQAIEMLKAQGVDTSGVTVDDTISTQTSCIIADRTADTRAIITTRVPPLASLTERAAELVLGSQWVHVDHGGYAATTALLSGRTDGPRVSLDSGNAPIPNLDLSRVDLYAPTLESLCAAQGTDDPARAAALALAKGCHAVVATSGSRGNDAWWDETGSAFGHVSGAGHQHTDAFTEGITIVSTLGAGDVFHGALLSALVHGCAYPDALQRASITAALSCQGRDGREAVPTWAEVDAIAGPTLS